MITINALSRGGFSAFGDAFLDQRTGIVIIRTTDDDETRPITVQFPETISAVTETEDGISGTAPSISGSAFTATLSSLTPGACITYAVTTASGVRQLTIQVARVGQVAVGDYGRYR